MHKLHLNLVFWVALTSINFAQQGSDTEQSWIRMDGKRLFMTFRGEVFLPDGSPAEDCKIKARIVESFEVEVEGNEFQLEAELKYGQHHPSLRFWAESKDGKLIAEHSVSSFDLRRAAQDGISITLKPSRTFHVKVIFDGQAVSNANVEVENSSGHNVRGRTNELGELSVSIPKMSELRKLSAWTEDKRIGGYSFRDGPPRDNLANEHVIELSKCREQKIRVVDESGNPVSGIELRTNVRTPSPHRNSVPRYEKREFVTDENGEAIDEWFPDWEEYSYTAEVRSDPWIHEDYGAFVDDVFVVRVMKSPRLERKEISGKLKISSKWQGGFLVRLNSHDHPLENRSDPIYARTDIEGNFTAQVMPGAAYVIVLCDKDWISNFWTGVLVNEDTGKVEQPTLKISRGPKIEVQLTGGAKQEPISNIWIVLDTRFSREWVENGVEHKASMNFRKSLHTDENGIAVGRMPLGPMEVKVREGNWEPSQKVIVKTGEVTRVGFHREFNRKLKLRGRLEFVQNPKANFEGARIGLVVMDGETRSEANGLADVDGSFELESAGGRFGIFAILADGSAAGFAITDGPEESPRISLKPTVTYRACLVDQDGNAIPNATVTMNTEIYDSRLLGTDFVVGILRMILEKTETDSDGNFEFKNVPQNVKVRFSVKTKSDARSAFLEQLTLDGSQDLETRKQLQFVRNPGR